LSTSIFFLDFFLGFFPSIISNIFSTPPTERQACSPSGEKIFPLFCF
jgi:hypothetical protein